MALAARLLLLLGSLGALWAGLEIFLRAATPASDADLFVFTADSPRYQVMRPDHEAHVYGVPLRTNALGFRDDDGTLPPKRDDRRRLVVLGDSFTVSAGVPYGEILTARLEAMLDVDVINLGCGGYNVVQYGHVLREVGLGLEPNAVLVALYVPNDFEMDTYRANRDVALGRRDRPRPPRFGRSLAWRFLETRAIGAYRRARMAAGLDTGRSLEALDGFEENVEALVRLRETATQHALALRVALLPGLHAWDRQAADHERVLDLCEELGLACVDLLPAFREGGEPPGRYAVQRVDPHPNAAYHALVAERLAPALRADLPR